MLSAKTHSKALRHSVVLGESGGDKGFIKVKYKWCKNIGETFFSSILCIWEQAGGGGVGGGI